MPCFTLRRQSVEDPYVRNYVKSVAEEHVTDSKVQECPYIGDNKKFQVYFRNGEVQELNNDAVFVKELINKAATAVGANQKYFNCYAITITSNITNKAYYLHPDLVLDEVEKKYCHNKSLIDEWKFAISVRYVPLNFKEFIEEDPVTFALYYYEIVAAYISGTFDNMDTKIVSKLCSLQMQLVLLKKKKQYVKRLSINMEEFIPHSILRDIKPECIRKFNKMYLKEFRKLDENDCMTNFLNTLRKTYFHIFYESYHVNYGCGVPVPTDISIGYNMGILNKMTGTVINFEEIEAIESTMPMLNEFGIVLYLTTSKERLIISSNDSANIDKIITLIDGYVKLHLNKPSIWIASRPSINKSVDIDTEDYSQPADRNYELNENKLEIFTKIATGKFSEIFRGCYKDKSDNAKNVAIKICNSDADQMIKEMFVEEAYMLHRFDHNHIVKLIGISSGKKPCIVTDYAEFGALHNYLQSHKFNLGLSTLLLFAYQVSLALHYLERLNHVHKNVATENILVFTPTCVKLSGFEILTFSANDSNKKLPIRWMAPESIKCNAFIQGSTVWSYGICVWEILTRGTKPYQNICDESILLTIERGERLKKPSLCSQKLYNLLLLCWEYKPENRPKFRNIKDIIYEIYLESKQDKA